MHCSISILHSTVSKDGDYPADSCRDSMDEANNIVVVDQRGHGDASEHHDHRGGHGMMAMLASMSGKMIMGTIKPFMVIARMMNPFKFVA